MRPRVPAVRWQAAILIAVIAFDLWVWRRELFTVQRPGDHPRPLAIRTPLDRVPATFDVVLPAVPVGMRRLAPGGTPLLVHYWAPWESRSRVQIAALDSLRREPDLERLQIVVVCADPFPSVARYVARQRLRLPVLLDGPGQLRTRLPCPSIPFTYVVDAAGRIAASQAGEVDWWSPVTRAALDSLVAERRPPATSTTPS